LRGRLEAAHRILHNDWRLYTAWNVVIKHPQLEKRDLESSLIGIYKDVYNLESSRERAAYFKRVLGRLIDEQIASKNYARTW